ncbi:MAG TPA: S8 family serine peptidase [Vicinamibacterales bacterium]|nr:S8 family serine peptidase [Vicinamibacterales bacterium]
MQVPVIVVLPRQEALRESFEAYVAGGVDVPRLRASVPSRLTLDPFLPAVPLGTGRLEQASTAPFDPARSEAFAVRGFIEAPNPAEIPVSIDGAPVFADPRIDPLPTCDGSPPLGDAAAVAAQLNVSGLAARGLDGRDVAIAVMDTGINLAFLNGQLGRAARFDAANSWTPPGSTIAPGGYPVDHGTMCAFDALIAAPNATLVDFPMLSAAGPGGSTVGRSVSVALVAFAQVLTSWAVAFASGGLSNYKSLVLTNSWGIYHPTWDFPTGHPGRYCDNPRHPFNQIVTTLASSGVDMVFAAGNCGASCPDMRCAGRTTETIMGANAHPDVLTVAGCDTGNVRVGYSSQGPAIAGMSAQKPDITAYTHFLGSQAFGAGSADSGTSAACPVAAGCVAALRTRTGRATTPSSSLFAQVRATARPVGVSGWNADCGFGIIDAVAAAGSLGL